jgi:hypothetical protein
MNTIMLKYTKSNTGWIQIDNKEIIKAIYYAVWIVSLVNITFFLLLMFQISVCFERLMGVLTGVFNK